MSSDDRIVSGTPSTIRQHAVEQVCGNGHALGKRQRVNLGESRQQLRARGRLAAYHADRLPGRAGHPGKWRQVRELLPQRNAPVGGRFGLDVGRGQGLVQPGDARRDGAGAVEHFAKRDAPVGARLLDHAWRRERRRDVRRAAHDGALPDDGGNGVRTVHAVLQRENDRGLSDQRPSSGNAESLS